MTTREAQIPGGIGVQETATRQAQIPGGIGVQETVVLVPMPRPIYLYQPVNRAGSY